MMNKNKILAYTVFSVFLLIRIFSAVAQEDIESVRDSSFERQTRPPVAFFHDAHNERAAIEECNVCHHVFESGKRLDNEDSVGMECSQCHFDKPQDTILDLTRAYHLQCCGCHVKQKAGPIICGQCHRKR